jgi:hypothetical protein
MLERSARHDVLAVTALGMRGPIFRWLSDHGARRLTPTDVRRLARAARRPSTA